MKPQWLIVPAILLLLAGCDDSTNPSLRPQLPNPTNGWSACGDSGTRTEA